jgi:tetratricopeptide (TPR) repeat protein
MNRSSHKTIWVVTGVFVLTACVVLLIRSLPLGAGDKPGTQDFAIQERDRQIAEMEELLETDWRIRRTRTRDVVDSVSQYAQHPTLGSAEAFFALGLVRMYKLYDAEGAEKALRSAIERDPEWSWSHDLLGVVLYSNGNHEGGLEFLEHAMALDPEWSRPHSDLAILFRLDEEWDLALEHAHIAIDMDPDHPIPYYNYGVILYKMGRHSEAQKQFEHVLELNSDLPAPYYNIACGFARSGQLAEALEYLAIAIELDPAFYEETLNDPDFDTVRSDPLLVEFLDKHHP